jgi:hypothetical protein
MTPPDKAKLSKVGDQSQCCSDVYLLVPPEVLWAPSHLIRLNYVFMLRLNHMVIHAASHIGAGYSQLSTTVASSDHLRRPGHPSLLNYSEQDHIGT